MDSNTRDNDIEALRSTIPTRQGVVELVREGYSYSQAGRIMGVSRQRAWAICQDEGMIRTPPPQYPRIKNCSTTRQGVEPHTFLAHSDKERKCKKHRNKQVTPAREGRHDNA